MLCGQPRFRSMPSQWGSASLAAFKKISGLFAQNWKPSNIFIRNWFEKLQQSYYLHNERPVLGTGFEVLLPVLLVPDKDARIEHWGVSKVCAVPAAYQTPRKFRGINHWRQDPFGGIESLTPELPRRERRRHDRAWWCSTVITILVALTFVFLGVTESAKSFVGLRAVTQQPTYGTCKKITIRL